MISLCSLFETLDFIYGDSDIEGYQDAAKKARYSIINMVDIHRENYDHEPTTENYVKYKAARHTQEEFETILRIKCPHYGV